MRYGTGHWHTNGVGPMKYKGNTPIKVGQLVHLTIDDEVWLEARVLDVLASQFTVRVNGGVRFFFYEDRDLTWRPAK